MGRQLLPLILTICAFMLASCRSTPNPYRPSFVEMARQNAYYHSPTYVAYLKKEAAPPTRSPVRTARRAAPPNYEQVRYAGLKFSDQLALNYAADKIEVLRPKFNRARYARETSTTTMIGAAALTGSAGTFNLGYKTLAWLGFGGAVIPQLQGLFDAKGRAENYQTAVSMIEDAVNQYLALNQNPSPDVLTQNGVTVVHRTDAAINLVEKSLTGLLPSPKEMAKATEPMTTRGATQTAAGSAAFNHVGEEYLPALPPTIVQVVTKEAVEEEKRKGGAELAVQGDKGKARNAVESLEKDFGTKVVDGDEIYYELDAKHYERILEKGGWTPGGLNDQYKPDGIGTRRYLDALAKAKNLDGIKAMQAEAELRPPPQ